MNASFNAIAPRAKPLWLLAATLALAACSGQQAPPQMPAPEVSVVTLTSERLAIDTQLPGRTVAYQSSDVRPQVGGVVRKRLFTEGTTVKAGQVLYEIEPATYQAAYDNARASLAQAEAEVLSARPKAERYGNLVDMDAVSKQDSDDAMASLRRAEAAVVAAKASLQTARINLDYTKVVAPISGRIGTSAYTPGALVTADQATALAQINQLDPIYVDVPQSSEQLLRLRRQLDSGALKAVDGKAVVTILLEDGSTYAEQGTLEVVGNAVDVSTGTVALRALVPNPKQVLLPGMYVKAVLAMAVNENAILVPQRAVTRTNKGESVVMVVDHEDKAQLRTLQVGAAVGDRWLVTEGLQAGDKVIVAGGQKVAPGMPVKAVTAAEAGTEAGAQAAPPAPQPAEDGSRADAAKSAAPAASSTDSRG